MDIAEFKKTLETIKKEWSNEAHSYIDENYFIYIKGNMKSSYVEKTFGNKNVNEYTIYYPCRSIQLLLQK